MNKEKKKIVDKLTKVWIEITRHKDEITLIKYRASKTINFIRLYPELQKHEQRLKDLRSERDVLLRDYQSCT